MISHYEKLRARDLKIAMMLFMFKISISFFLNLFFANCIFPVWDFFYLYEKLIKGFAILKQFQ